MISHRAAFCSTKRLALCTTEQQQRQRQLALLQCVSLQQQQQQQQQQRQQEQQQQQQHGAATESLEASAHGDQAVTGLVAYPTQQQQ
eukprot:jgi/Chrzof1/9111/Cz03g36120.t1